MCRSARARAGRSHGALRAGAAAGGAREDGDGRDRGAHAKARGKRPLSLISAAVDGAASPTTPKRAAPAATPERAPGAAAADRGGDYATMQSLLRTMRFVRE